MIAHLSDRKHAPVLEPLEALRQKVCRAIVTMYAEGRFYDGLDLLCSIAGWPSFRNELYSPEAMDAWIREQGAGKMKSGKCEVGSVKREVTYKKNESVGEAPACAEVSAGRSSRDEQFREMTHDPPPEPDTSDAARPERTDRYNTKKCGACGRRYDPKKVYQRKSLYVCAECGRRMNSRYGGGDG